MAIRWVGDNGVDKKEAVETFIYDDDLGTVIGWTQWEMYGKGGDDILVGGKKSDILDGGDGWDQLTGREGNDRIDGDRGNDTLLGGGGHDKLAGDQGDDIIFGDNLNDYGGDDIILGGSGNDVLLGGTYGYSNSGEDFLTGGSGADTFHLGAKEGTFYRGSKFDRAVITDFDDQEGDQIKLWGSAHNYMLETIEGDTHIFFQDFGVDPELIGIIWNTENLDLNASYFNYNSGLHEVNVKSDSLVVSDSLIAESSPQMLISEAI